MDGQEVQFHSPRHAIEAGIGMVHQHFRLIQSFTVAQNVVLGRESERRSPMVSPAEMVARVDALADQFRLPVRSRARVWQLSVGEQQRVEILKVLYRDADILILDEPTAVLTPQESQSLFATLRHMADGGRTVIFISHKLNEVMDVADTVTVLRKGRTVSTVPTAETSARELAALMVGRNIELARRQRTPGAPHSAPRLSVQNVSVLDDLGQRAVRDVSFDVAGGEIFGLAGVAGNGQRELLEVVSGLRHRVVRRHRGRRAEAPGADPRRMIDAGVAYVPEDRLGDGPRAEPQHCRQPGAQAVPAGAAVDWADPPATAHPGSGTDDAGGLRHHGGSGFCGPATLGREPPASHAGSRAVERSEGPPRRIADAGLDVGATEMVRKLLLQATSAGLAVVLVSEDLDEIRDLSDRIGVMYEGRIVGFVDADRASAEELGLMMAGASG